MTPGEAKAEAKAAVARAKAMRPWFKKKRVVLPLILLVVIVIAVATNGGDDEEKVASGITPNLIRIAVGLEHVDDIRADLEKGLKNI